jgi:hypothetical protein
MTTTALAKGIARISFPGGGTVLPAENAYDWEILMEYVADNARTSGQVEIRVDDQRWLVRCIRGPSEAGCSRCGHFLYAACCSARNAETSYCVKCIFASSIESTLPAHERHCGASRAR